VTDTAARVRLSRNDRRDNFLDVTAQIVVEKGADAVTMEGVAARAGVSKALAYTFFANRDDLLAALHDREAAVLDERIAEALALGGTLEQRSRAVMHAWFDVVSERGPLITAAFGGNRTVPVLEARDRSRGNVAVTWLANLIASEHPNMPPKTRMIAAGIVLSGAAGAMELWARHDVSRNDAIEIYLTLALGGLRSLAGAVDGAD
jgi:AcrR family transcriptional regulator